MTLGTKRTARSDNAVCLRFRKATGIGTASSSAHPSTSGDELEWKRCSVRAMRTNAGPSSNSAVVKGRQGIGGEPWRPSPAPRDEEIAPAAENHINETDGDANLCGHANSCELLFAHVTRRRRNHTSGLLDRERIIEPSRDQRRRNRSIGSIQRKNPRPDAAMSPNPIKNATSPKLPAARNRLFVGPCGIGSGLSSSMMVLLFSETTHWFHNVLRLRKVPSLQKDFAQPQQGVCSPGTQWNLPWMMRDGG